MSQIKLSEKDILKLLRTMKRRYPLSLTVSSMVKHFDVSTELLHRKLSKLVADGKVEKVKNNYYIK